jgi:hypothetical protein
MFPSELRLNFWQDLKDFGKFSGMQKDDPLLSKHLIQSPIVGYSYAALRANYFRTQNPVELGSVRVQAPPSAFIKATT